MDQTSDWFKYKDSPDYFRTIALFEWTFAIFVANLTLQASQLVTQIAAFVFDMFRLAYGKEIFGSLTNDDIKPYSQYLVSKYELAFKLGENVLLTVAAYFMAKSLLNFSLVGLGICFVIFVAHEMALIFGAIFLLDKFEGLLSVSSALWLITIIVELVTLVLCATVIIVLI